MKRNLFKKTMAVMAMATMMTATFSQSAFAEENVTYYFVDCGDFETSTVSEGDAFGIYNSVTEQLYGTDAETGKKWGLVDGDYSLSGSYDANYTGTYGIRTQWTWANEWCPATGDIVAGTAERDGHAKEFSNRYTKDMVGNADVEMTYKFELPAGTYDLEIGFWDSWNNANNPTINVNGTALATDYAVDNNELKFAGEFTVSDGEMELNVAGGANDLCVILSYIKISGEAPVDNSGDDDDTNGSGADNSGADNSGADNSGADNSGADNSGADNSNDNNATPDTGDTTSVITLVALATIAAAIVLKRKAITE